MKKRLALTTMALGIFIVGGKNVLAAPNVYSSVNIVTTQGKSAYLPKEIVALDDQKGIVKEKIMWNQSRESMFDSPGSYEVYGKTANNTQVKGVITVFPKEQKVKVAAVGDSITYGMNVESRTTNSYPLQLGQRLGSDYQVENFGHSARTLLEKGDLPYLKSPQFKKSLDFDPNVVVIQLGTNDTKSQNIKFLDQFVDDYVKLIHTYKNLSKKPVVYISLPPHIFKTAYGITQSSLDKTLPKIFEAAKEANVDVSIIDNFTETDEAIGLIPDGVHPNARGAAILANNVYYNLKGESPILDESMALNDYFKTYGGLNVNKSGNLEIQKLSTNDWVSFNNVQLTGHELQLNASVPYDDTKVTISNEKGEVVGEGVLAKTGSVNKYKSQVISLNKAEGIHDLKITFARDKSKVDAEIIRLAKADFHYDSTKPVEISSYDEFISAIEENVTNLKLTNNIVLKSKIQLAEDTVIDLNAHQLDTGSYYIGKDEKVGRRLTLSLLNGELKGKNSSGSIYTANSTKDINGFNLEFENINYDGKVTQTNFSPNSMITEKGNNQLIHALSSSNTLVYKDFDLSQTNGCLELTGAVPYADTQITVRKGSETGEIVGSKVLERTKSVTKEAHHSIQLTNVAAREDLFIKVERKGTNGYTELFRLN